MTPVVLATCDPLPVWFAGVRGCAAGFDRFIRFERVAWDGEMADDPVLEPARAAPATPVWS